MELLEVVCDALSQMLSVPNATTVKYVESVARTVSGQIVHPILIALTVVRSEDVDADMAETQRMRAAVNKLGAALNSLSQVTSGAIFSEVNTMHTTEREIFATRESPHNYHSNMNVVEEVTFPQLASLMYAANARVEKAVASAHAQGKRLNDEEKAALKPSWLSTPRKVKLVWDPQTKTEGGCDHIQVCSI